MTSERKYELLPGQSGFGDGSVMSDTQRTTKPRAKRGSMRAAINAFCKGCIYDRSQPGTWRQQVKACTSVRCALFQFRPVSAANEEVAT